MLRYKRQIDFSTFPHLTLLHPDSTDQAEAGSFIGKDTDNPSTPIDITIEPYHAIVRGTYIQGCQCPYRFVSSR